jgi:Lrp/AsnC family leucine-responsive transcriptional regulator
MDANDLKILKILQEDARTPNAEIARAVDMAPSAILERIRKLEERGVIQGYAARLDPIAVERRLLAFVFVSTEASLHDEEVVEAVEQFPEVLEVHDVAGEDSYLLKVRVGDTEELHHFLREKLARVKRVSATRTVFVLKSWKETSALPLPPPRDGKA